MRPPRVSILGLLAWIALVGVGLAALRSPSPLWANALFSLTLATLIVSALAVAYRRHRRRAFWVGFATFGWAYFLATLGPAPLSQIGPHLLTTALLDILYPQVVPPPDPPAAVMPVPVPPGPQGAPAPAPSAMIPARPTPAVLRPASLKAFDVTRRVILTGAFGGPPPTPLSAWASWNEPDRDPGGESAVGGRVLLSPTTFRRIGHAISCLLAALVGGLLTQHLHATRDEPEPAEA
jgi:hypothetical protein